MANNKVVKGVATSKFRGVSYNKRIQKWRSVYYTKEKIHFLGNYPEELEAAHEWDKKAREMGVAEAMLNFPGSLH